jgi:23S rRNA (pseudouridine1915-N3)-methyltransferase
VKIKFICIGKTGKSFLEEGEQTYLKRLTHYLPIERIELPDIKNAKKLSEEQIKEKEGQAILSKVETSDRLFLLDERGKEFTSEGFADFLQKQFNFITQR